MKVQIRRGVFETNSSNEHSLTIMDRNKYHAWQTGKLLARKKTSHEDGGCWGNFWSKLYTFEFTDDFSKAETDNLEILNQIKEKGLAEIEEYKEKCLNHVKLVEHILTEEEEAALSEEELEKYQNDLYEDSLYEFDEEDYNHWKDIYENLTIENFNEHFSMFEDRMWLTFNDFWKDFIEDGDCYSPFQHDDGDNGVYIIGKYFHS